MVGNVFSYLVSSKQKVVLQLRRKNKLAPGIIDFVFKSSQKLAFQPGQYMEFTLAHPRPDSRGNRRYFTLASSPTEEGVRLGVRFYQQGSSVKQALYRIDNRKKSSRPRLQEILLFPPTPLKNLSLSPVA